MKYDPIHKTVDRSTKTVSCYVNSGSHLLNRYNPNVVHSELPYTWRESDWHGFIEMIHRFGFTTIDFKLLPFFFCGEGLEAEAGQIFARQMRSMIEHAHRIGLSVKMLCSLATSGKYWHTLCPNEAEEWAHCRMLWDAWTRRLPGVDIVRISPGDPGACSRNGCTAETYIDKTLEVAGIIKNNLPEAEIELGTWGNPFFGWGCIQGPAGWKGEFLQSYQRTAWRFDKKRADDAMDHLLQRLPSFPRETTVSINLAFNPDGDPEANNGARDARPWVRKIAETHRIVTWNFSLTEGENAIIPHYRFDRLYAQRQRERDAAPYQGGICFTMTPLLNQLSLFQAAQSFADPDADHRTMTDTFYTDLFGPDAKELADLLPLFEIVPDWGNHSTIDISRQSLHQKMMRGVELLEDLEHEGRDDAPFHPGVEDYRRELLFFFQLFSELSGPHPDFERLRHRYWNRVYAIYDHLEKHVDPRPRRATNRLIDFFSQNVCEKL